MPGGKNNTQRIETLEDRAANVAARLDVLDTQIEGIKAVLQKGAEDAEEHTTRITVVEQQILVLPEMKIAQAAIVSVEKDLLALRKDLESLQKWRDEMKKEREESTRRLWAFGPNLTAALVSGFITILGIGITVTLNYLLRR
jgi:chromosome segregation ATPase